jgi:hypothetical protein
MAITAASAPAKASGSLAAGCYAASFGIALVARLVGGVLSPAPRASSPPTIYVAQPPRTTARPAVTAARRSQARTPASPLVRALRAWKERMKRFIAEIASRRDGVWEYALVTAAYWGFTITDGAIRMLVLLQFFFLGYSAFQIAFLFLFYEVFGVVTNLVGGWIGANWGLRVTLLGGIGIQIAALLMLAVLSASWPVAAVVAWVMIAQALSGIAKDLTKMSAKSAIKAVVPANADATLYRWVALLTGSKNALKGVGFFVGALLLTVAGFAGSSLIMAAGLAALLVAMSRVLPHEIGRSSKRAKFSAMFAMDRRINVLSAARLFLFGARDVWFVVALPVYFSAIFGWSPVVVGAYLALWTIGYGIIQSTAPRFICAKPGETPKGYTVMSWAAALAGVPVAIAMAIGAGIFPAFSIVAGLAVFGVLFAINSAVHSYMIVHYAESEKVAMTIGFYYMANAGGRLLGTVLSGIVYQFTGIVGCLMISGAFVGTAALISSALVLPDRRGAPGRRAGSAPLMLRTAAV